MESLSHTRKVPNAASLSAKNAYDGVFYAHRHRYAGAPTPDVRDYGEIFGSSQAASSIPVLDLTTLGRSSDASNLNLRSSIPDYSKIFGGFLDEDIAVSYQELFARDKARAASPTRPTSEDLDNLSHQSFDALKQFNMSYHKISQRSKDGLDGTAHVTKLHAVPAFTCFIDEAAPRKKMDAGKHKSSALHGVDSNKEGFPEKQLSGSAVKHRSKHDHSESFSEDKSFSTFGINHESHPSTISSPSDLPTNVDNHENYSNRSAVIYSRSCKTDTPESAPAEFSTTYFSEELDVNSAAATSAAALKKAIEKAQESIRIAKESVGRKKKGLRSFSSKTSKDSLNAETRMEVTAGEEQKGKDDEVRGKFERVGAASQVLPDVGRNHKYGGTVAFPDSMDSEKLFVAKKVIDEIHGKISESTKECLIPVQSPNQFNYSTIVSNSTCFLGEMESSSLDSAGKHEYSEAVGTEKGRTMTSTFEQADQTSNKSVVDYEGKIKVTKTTTWVFEHLGVVEELESFERACDPEEVGKWDAVRTAQGKEGGADTRKSACFLNERRENGTYGVPQEDGASVQRPKGFFVHESCDKILGDSKETVEFDKSRGLENKDEVRLSDGHTLVAGSNNSTVSQKVEDEKRVSQGSNQNENKKRLNAALGLLENEKLEEVLEQEYIEKVENEERNIMKSDDEESEKELEEASQGLESRNESKDDHNTESHKKEEISEMFYDVCELEMKDGAHTCDTSIEESEATLQDNFEMKQEDNTGQREGESLDEACDQEFNENPLSDDNDTGESDTVDGRHIVNDIQESYKVDINNNDVETTQEVDDVRVGPVHVTGASCEFQVEATETMKVAYVSEGEFFEKTTINGTVSEDNEDECEVKFDNLADLGSADTDFGQNETEENDVWSESSSGSILGVEMVADESKKEKNIIDEKIVFREEGESNIQPSHKEIPKIGSTNEIKVSQEYQVSNETEKPVEVNEEIGTSQHREKEYEIGETGASEVAGEEHRRRIDEITARKREREKNRIAVDRAIREARERAFAEACERAERAAVEKATAEVRQRMVADAREKIAKASVGTKSSSERTSAHSKLRAERAAVERATSEARQRALEKAMSQKSISDAGVQANRESSSSSSLHSYDETSTESAQRRKAKLEKHNRIMERAAKALAEKEKRDLLAQKEQAERNRLAENLDADIKRWSSGKDGNLRALLSTLQYILGPDSGWQPVPLTEIITNSAVKKAYRKATLCVHPDKLQQRGASIQHKYICEKVFDLLKAAWNRSNSEER